MNLDTAGSRPMRGPTQAGGANPPPQKSADASAGPLGDRIEAATKNVPEPKGKGVVMMLLAVAVVIALIWEFSGKGAASQATRRAVEREQREKSLEGEGSLPLARDNPDDKPSTSESASPPRGGTPPSRGATPPRQAAPRQAALIDVKINEMTATLPPALAVAAWVETDAANRGAMRVDILEKLVPLAKRGGNAAREAFESATWLLDGAGDEAMEAILHLTNATPAALEDDTAALAAILFLSRVPDGVDKRTALSLDGVIADRTRPLSIRLAAANARPKQGLSKRIQDLISDPMTHPALRDALK